jgi:hypothetical protein
MMKVMRLDQDRMRNNCCLPRQPIRTYRSRTAPCRWSGGCPRPHSAGRRGRTPCRSWGRTGSAHRLPRWTATKAGRTAWSASSRRAGAGVGKAQCRRVQAREASCSDGMCSSAIGGSRCVTTTETWQAQEAAASAGARRGRCTTERSELR